MKKILFIGNSHIGSLKKGYDKLIEEKSIGDYKLFFLGIPRDQIHTFFKIRNINEIFFKDSYKEFTRNLSADFSKSLNSYDFIIWVQSYSPLDPRCFYRLGRGNLFDFELLSNNIIEEIFNNENYLTTSFMFSDEEKSSNKKKERILKIISLLRNRFSEKFIFLGMPFISLKENMLRPKDRQTISNKEWAKMFREQNERIKSIFKKWNNHYPYKFCFPPDKVLDSTGIYTKKEYAFGALDVNADKRIKDFDAKHMNGDYGKEILNYLLQNLE